MGAADSRKPRGAGHANLLAQSETRGEYVGTIAIFCVCLVLLAAMSIFLPGAILHYFETHDNGNQARPVESNLDAHKLPPEPRLQDNAVGDLRKMQSEEDRILNTYEWVDQKKGVVRIPISRAIDLLAQRGLSGHRAPGKRGKPDKENAPAEAGVVGPARDRGAPSVKGQTNTAQREAGQAKLSGGGE